MKLRLLALIAAFSMLACNSPKKEKESKTTTGTDTVKVVPKDQSVTQKTDSSNQSAIAKAEDKTEKSNVSKTDQKTAKKGNTVVASKDKSGVVGKDKSTVAGKDKTTVPAKDSDALPDPGTIPFEKSTPIAFKEFRSKTLKSLPLVRLPLNLEQAASKVKVHAYPAGSFDMPNGFNAERMLVGILPDTSTYYGVVWKGYMPDPRHYTQPGKHTLAYLTTFSKSGKMISNVQLQLEYYPEGPSDCGNYKSEHRSVIEPDYSFTSTQETSFKCQGESEPRTTSEKLVGNVERNGTIVVHRSNGESAKGGGR
jgi:hypothetical protein